jgi:hypothetical protein
MKQMIALGAAMFFTLLGACDQIQDLTGPSPEKVLTAYFDATKAGNWDAAYAHASTQDQAAKPLADYKSEVTGDNAIAAAVLSKTSYQVLSVERQGNRAKATVEVTSPDLGGMFAELLQSAFASALGGKGAPDAQKQMTEKLQAGNLPTKTQREEFALIREEKGWRVFFDWTTKKQVAGLLAEAEQLRKQRKLPAAREKYDAVLKLDSKVVEAQEGRDEVGREIAAFEEKQAYVANVELYDLKARYYDTYLERRIPGVEFKLRNKGNRSLRKVEVTVYFQDASGAVIAEQEYNPVLVTKYSFRGDNKPLRPNYIWQLERGEFYQAKSVPTEWKEGAVRAKITDIEFGDGTE